jgi:hypothetical protein
MDALEEIASDAMLEQAYRWIRPATPPKQSQPTDHHDPCAEQREVSRFGDGKDDLATEGVKEHGEGSREVAVIGPTCVGH